jgi:hypothetical protein
MQQHKTTLQNMFLITDTFTLAAWWAGLLHNSPLALFCVCIYMTNNYCQRVFVNIKFLCKSIETDFKFLYSTLWFDLILFTNKKSKDPIDIWVGFFSHEYGL